MVFISGKKLQKESWKSSARRLLYDRFNAYLGTQRGSHDLGNFFLHAKGVSSPKFP